MFYYLVYKWCIKLLTCIICNLHVLLDCRCTILLISLQKLFVDSAKNFTMVTFTIDLKVIKILPRPHMVFWASESG